MLISKLTETTILALALRGNHIASNFLSSSPNNSRNGSPRDISEIFQRATQIVSTP